MRMRTMSKLLLTALLALPGKPTCAGVSSQDADTSSKNVIYIDVRSKTKYDDAHIAQSVNLPYYMIQTKSFWKKTHLILVGTGWDENRIEQVAHELRGKGFEYVSVLRGGIRGWIADGGPWSGRDSLSTALLSGSEFLHGLHTENNWNVIQVGETTLPAQDSFAVSMVSPEMLSTRSWQQENEGQPCVIMMDDMHNLPASREECDAYGSHVFFVQETTSEIERRLTEQQSANPETKTISSARRRNGNMSLGYRRSTCGCE